MTGRSELKLVATTLLVVAMVSACSSTGRRDAGPLLGDILPVWVSDEGRELPDMDMDQVLEQYHAVLEVAKDPEIRIKVQRRLAGLEMARSEQRQIDEVQAQRYFDEAISLYQTLLAANPERGDNDRLLYQMAKAYELDGRVEESGEVLGRLALEFPDSEYYAEAMFRHGEMLFSQQRYALAERDYRAVIEAGEDSSYFDNAIYMHGWSLFKQSRYQASLGSFGRVLDRTVPPSGDIEDLPRAELEMTQDTLWVMSLVFSYLDGAVSIGEYTAHHGARPYNHYLYDSLGKLYLEKQRYRDSAETYGAYVEQYPDSDFAVGFSVQLIDVYQAGSFPSEILPAKEAFARHYGIHSAYWSARDAAVKQQIRPHLHQYLEELAKHYHATAQSMQNDPSMGGRAAASPARQEEIGATFLIAAGWYAEFAETFPGDEATPAMVFLMAESLNEAGALPRAIAAYEQVAYDYLDPTQGAEAGYSAILAYDQYLVTLSPEEFSGWQLQKIESELRFAEIYSSDARALPVLTRAAEELLQTGNARDAVIVAARVSGQQAPVDRELLRTAWLVQGHGHFQMADYVASEQAYNSVLLVMGSDDEARGATVDRLAASIYKQAEVHLATGESSQAIDDFLRVASVAPGSVIAVKAQYDGANQLMALESWDRAAREFDSFRRDYPGHELAASIPVKMAHIHQQQGQWRQAADELSLIAAQDPDPEVSRQSLYMAAELYEKDGALDLAIARYAEYVGGWPQPFELANEARYQLSELYHREDDGKNRRHWLQQLMSSHDSAGSQASERSRYLAAMSAAVFADDNFRNFRDVPLQLPLKRSLKTKKVRMQATLAAYERVLGYGVAEFVTEASYRIGEVYAILSSDLMDSERPMGLSALELEQYELLLEEQVYPFEEKAIDIHEANARRSWSGVYDQWVRRSIGTLATLLPARYGKSEKLVRYSNDIY